MATQGATQPATQPATQQETQTQVPLEEYLATSYRPDCEYMDGEIRERNVGKWEHARLQALLTVLLHGYEKEWGLLVSTEQRTQVSLTRVRVPDLVLVRAGRQPDVLLAPPVLIVEILLPADTFSGLRERVNDYQRMGVETVWIIDPNTRTGQVCSGDSWTSAGTLTVAGTSIQVELDPLFRSLDDFNGPDPV